VAIGYWLSLCSNPHRIVIVPQIFSYTFTHHFHVLVVNFLIPTGKCLVYPVISDAAMLGVLHSTQQIVQICRTACCNCLNYLMQQIISKTWLFLSLTKLYFIVKFHIFCLWLAILIDAGGGCLICFKFKLWSHPYSSMWWWVCLNFYVCQPLTIRLREL